MSLRSILSISVLALAAAAFTSATPVLFDDFNDPTGPLDGQNGGIGWAGSWVGIPEYTVASGSLSYPGLAAIGQPGAIHPDDFGGHEFHPNPFVLGIQRRHVLAQLLNQR